MASIPDRHGIVLYHAQGCSLCDRARSVLDAVGAEYGSVDITGVPELESAYREWLPVVEIDGERAFVYFVDEAGLRRRLARRERPGS